MTMETTTQETTTWQDVATASAEASAEAFAPRTEKRLVRVKLTPQQREDLANELEQELADLDALEDEGRSYNADLRERKTTAKTRIKAIRAARSDGYKQEERAVIVRRVNASTVQLVDPETGAILDEIADVEDDRQLTLADAAKGNGHAEEDEDASDDLDLSSDPDDESPDLEDRLDRALAEADADPADASLDGDEPAAGDIVDPAGVLEGAAPDEEQPKKRGRGKRS